MKLLLHTCCAPCSVACVASLREEGIEPTAYWNNPNIHPLTEYRARLGALRAYAQSIGMALVEEGDYGLRPFVRAVADNIEGRCAYCYETRMQAAARYAAENGFTHFTTTLFISPYQNHELLKQIALRAAQDHGIEPVIQGFPAVISPGATGGPRSGTLYAKNTAAACSARKTATRRKIKAAKDKGGTLCLPACWTTQCYE